MPEIKNKKTTEIILIRSASTEWNRTGRIQGDIDVPPNDKGIAKNIDILTQLESINIDAVYSSPLVRCALLAENIARGHKAKMKKITALKEYHQGLWQGLLIKEIKERYKKQFALWRETPFRITPPRGEAPNEFYDRVISNVQKLVDRNIGKTICIVTHQLVALTIKCHYSSIDIKGDIWQYNLYPGDWEVLEAENTPIEVCH